MSLQLVQSWHCLLSTADEFWGSRGFRLSEVGGLSSTEAAGKGSVLVHKSRWKGHGPHLLLHKKCWACVSGQCSISVYLYYCWQASIKSAFDVLSLHRNGEFQHTYAHEYWGCDNPFAWLPEHQHTMHIAGTCRCTLECVSISSCPLLLYPGPYFLALPRSAAQHHRMNVVKLPCTIMTHM